MNIILIIVMNIHVFELTREETSFKGHNEHPLVQHNYAHEGNNVSQSHKKAGCLGVVLIMEITPTG